MDEFNCRIEGLYRIKLWSWSTMGKTGKRNEAGWANPVPYIITKGHPVISRVFARIVALARFSTSQKATRAAETWQRML
jgi:hypothetical protein